MSLAKTVSAKVLDFWYAGKYATPAERNKGALMKMWWQGDAALDAQVRSPLTKESIPAISSQPRFARSDQG